MLSYVAYGEIPTMIPNDSLTHKKLHDEEASRESNNQDTGEIKSLSAKSQMLIKASQDIRNSCERRSVGDAKKLELTEYVRSALGLSESDTNEIVQLKTSTPLESYTAYRELMAALMQHEMGLVSWKGELSTLSNEILSLYAHANSLSDLNVLYARWSALSDAYEPSQNPDVSVICDTLDRIIDENSVVKATTKCIPLARRKKKSSVNQPADGEIKNSFWAGSDSLLRKFAQYIAGDLHSNSIDDASRLASVSKMLDVTKQLEALASKQLRAVKFVEFLIEEISLVTEAHFDRCVSRRVLDELDDDEMCLSVLLFALENVAMHYRDVVERHSATFESIPDCKYAEHVYRVYDEKLEEVINPMIGEISQRLKQGSPATVVMTAVKLYEQLRRFTQIGLESFEDSDFQLRSFSQWFPTQLVTVIDTPMRLSRAVDTDESSEFAEFKRTSSALHSMEIICTVYTFWQQFTREEARENEIIEFIASDLCRLALNYIDKYTRRIESLESESMPLNASVAVANFQYILEQMQALLTKLIQDFTLMKSMEVIEIFKKTFREIQDRMNSTVKASIETCMPVFRKSVMEAAATEENANEFTQNLIENLETLELNLKQARFEVAKAQIWHEIINNLPQIMQDAIDDKEQQDFFTNLNGIWMRMKDTFSLPIETEEMREKVANFEESLDWYGADSSQLFCRQYESLKETALNTPTATVHCSFKDCKLVIEVLHAQKLHLVAPESNCHSFIQLKLFHGDAFDATPRLRTKVHENTHCPLFDEVLEFELTEAQMKLQNALIYVTLHREMPLGYCVVLGEAFLSFNEIPAIDSSSKMPLRKELNFLKMTNIEDRQSMRVLKHRGSHNGRATIKLLSTIEQRESPPTVKMIKKQMTEIVRSSVRRGSKQFLRFKANQSTE